MKIQSLVALLVFLVLVTIVCGVGISVYRSKGLPIAASGQAFALEQALAEYHTELGSYPPEGSNAEITAALQGANPQEFDFLLSTGIKYEVFIAAEEQADGSRIAVDVWKNPLQIKLPPSVEVPTVISSGPDGVAGNSDDISSEKARTLQPAKNDEEANPGA